MKPNNNIIFFLPDLEGGGAERAVLSVANELAERGYSTKLLLLKKKGKYISEASKTLDIESLECSRMIFSIPSLISFLRKEKPAYFVSSLDYANIIAILAAKLSLSKTRIIVCERTTQLPYATAGKSERQGMIQRLIKIFYPMADAVIAVSGGAADALSTLSGIAREKISVIFNSVDVERATQLSRTPVNDPWVKNNSDFILAVGRLTDAKDYPTLLRAFDLVSREERKLKLVILGEGEERDKLQKLAIDLNLKDRVYMPGFKENPFSWMSLARLFVMSSKIEGFPNVLTQAMACGLPIVSTNCKSGPSEILEDGKWGRLVSVGDHQQLAQAIKDTLASTSLPNVEERARFFTIEKTTDAYLQTILGNQAQK